VRISNVARTALVAPLGLAAGTAANKVQASPGVKAYLRSLTRMVRPRLVAVSLGFLGAAVQAQATSPGGDSTPAPDDVRMEITLLKGSTFHIGERIPIALEFTSSAPNKYRMLAATGDASGRLPYETLEADPATGWKEPLEAYFSGAVVHGGLSRPDDILSETPVRIPVDMNEWIRFDEPGLYHVRARTSRVSALAASDRERGLLFRRWLVSAPVEVTITPANAEWVDGVLKSATTLLDRPSGQDRTQGEALEAQGAARTLRFLGTRAAAREMADRLTISGNEAFEMLLGLFGYPDPSVARAEVQRVLFDPRVGLEDSLRSALVLVADKKRATTRAETRANQTRERDLFLAALDKKTGIARLISIDTSLRLRLAPEDKREAFASELCAGLPSVPASMQKRFLDSGIQAATCPEAIRVFRDWVGRDTESLPWKTRFEAEAMAATGLRRWYEADPVGARPALLEEILRSHRRFGAAILGVLPDKTLPEADTVFVAALGEGGYPSDATLSLLERYATSKILPSVLAFVDKALGAPPPAGCGQEFALAYILRLDPEAARPRVEKTLGLREGNRCYRYLLGHIGKLEHDPVLEQLATAHLEDTDSAVATDAARYLGQFGSDRAEDPLWNRYESWSREWRGRDVEMSEVLLRSGGAEDSARLGYALADALARAPGWILDEAKIERLRSLAVGDDARRVAEPVANRRPKKP
jgi:hypothetical protein